MRTSKISQETTRIFNALSGNARHGTTRTTRSAKRIASFALGHDGSVEVKEEDIDVSETRLPSASPSVADIEDGLSSPPPSRKRKRGSESPPPSRAMSTSKTHIKAERVSVSPQKPLLNSTSLSPTTSRAKAKPKVPARRKTNGDGTTSFSPPANWEEVYNIVKTMRDRNPVAPVDTMGCEDLFWQSAPPKEQRYHTLVALMLSSQTKDTVTAAAMYRLHTELAPSTETSNSDGGKSLKSSLTIQNILSATPQHLDSLISKVGFHNNKTKFLQATAAILAADYDHDIPNTLEGLVSLPGVGPKMAFLCLSAAWGLDLGIGVDVHVHRITNLWGWHTTKTPEETRMWLEGWLPRDKWHEINKLLVGLGQTVCLPVGRRCGECDLAGTGLCKAEVRKAEWSPRKIKVKAEDKDVKVVQYEGMGGERVVEEVKGEVAIKAEG